ncbi:DUF3556 domain-containing protein [Nitriliruptoraceae bacterium ZYF776]|nr:DUF3556 domain-containing protein [Profundirhabdus halotolerans]
MGYKQPDFPQVDPATYRQIPFLERMRTLQRFWVEYGFGTAKSTHVLYVYKITFYLVVGLLLAWVTTPALPAITDVGAWIGEPIVYQKLLAWTVLFEVLGLASSSGPLSFKFSPMIGGVLFWARRGTLRVPPYPNHVPFTKGGFRTTWDVAVYLGILASCAWLIASQGVDKAGLPDSVVAGVLPTTPLLVLVGLQLLMALRDKIVFLASRSEQYLFITAAFALFSFVDAILAAKIVMTIVWFGAGVSKFGRHFSNVVAPMISNAPWITSKRFKRSLYRSFPDDLRPSKNTLAWAHIGGSLVELTLPLVLLFSTDRTLTLLAVAGMICFHLFIIAAFPLAVPLEWNVFFIFATPLLFLGFHASEGYAVTDLSSPWVLAAILAASLTWPILGNLKPKWVSFLWSMRQYAGNWPSATWAFRGPEAEQKLNEHITKPAALQVDQLAAGYGREIAEIYLEFAVAWRMMNSHARGLLSVMLSHLDDPENYELREAEFVCSALVGWQFGDGHLHDERLIAAVQERCRFAPGELLVVFVESQPIHTKVQHYRVIDAALGVVERGTWHIDDLADEQPWLPNGPVKHEVTWTAPGYRRAGADTTAWERAAAYRAGTLTPAAAEDDPTVPAVPATEG